MRMQQAQAGQASCGVGRQYTGSAGDGTHGTYPPVRTMERTPKAAHSTGAVSGGALPIPLEHIAVAAT